MISKYPTLNFSLKYNDEYGEEWLTVACQGVLIDSEMICYTFRRKWRYKFV